jgi:hypothetical protein
MADSRGSGARGRGSPNCEGWPMSVASDLAMTDIGQLIS